MSIILTRRDHIAHLTLNRPEAMNALSGEMLLAIDKSLNEIAASDARVLIVTGAGPRAFCAGADIGGLLNGSLHAQQQRLRFGQQVFDKLSRLRLPSIAAINGYAYGGGLELALACTFRIAAPNAKMGLPEVKLGLIPAYGGTQRLPRLIGAARATEMILTGRTLNAAEAINWGMVNQVSEDDITEAAVRFSNGFAGHSLHTMQLAQQAIARGANLPMEAALALESDLAAMALASADAAEGIAAFQSKRVSRFSDC